MSSAVGPVADHEGFPVRHEEFEPPPMDVRVRRFEIPWEWFDAIGIYFTVALFLGLAIGALQLVMSDPDDVAVASVPLNSLLLLAVTTTWVGVRASRAQVPHGIRRLFGPKRPILTDVALGIGYGLAALVVIQFGLGTLLTTVIQRLGSEVPDIQPQVQQAIQGSGVAPVVLVIVVALLTPIAEEMLLRGLLYQALAKRMPGWPAIGLSGLAFALAHVEPFVVVLTLPLGVFLAYIFRRHGTLVVPVVAHLVFNLVAVLLIRSAGS